MTSIPDSMKQEPITYTQMMMTGGRIDYSIFSVLAPCYLERYSDGKPFRIHTTEARIVASYAVSQRGRPPYLQLAERHATPGAPAFFWPAGHHDDYFWEAWAKWKQLSPDECSYLTRPDEEEIPCSE